jgi:YfiH family protein
MSIPELPTDFTEAAWWPELAAAARGAHPLRQARMPRMLMSTREPWGSDAASRGAAPYDHFNLGDHVGDDPAVVLRHRQWLAQACGVRPVWLEQVHGHRVVRLSSQGGRLLVDGSVCEPDVPIVADGSFTTEPGLVCTAMVADCLPVLLASPQGRGVAALHAGWRGLCGAGVDMAGQGVIEKGVAAVCEACECKPADLMAWLGPCIGPTAFEVGADVLAGFGVVPDEGHPAFQVAPPVHGQRKWHADLAWLGRRRLHDLGVRQIDGGHWCTVSEPGRFFSFRRDGVTGRQAACIWLVD